METGDIVGINLNTGKARKYQKGDEYVGIVSDNAGFVGNSSEDIRNSKNYTLVGLQGQLEFDESQVHMKGRIIMTKDKKFKIGVLLSNGKVFIR